MEKEGTPYSNLQILLEKYVNNSCSKNELRELLKLAQDQPEEFEMALKDQWNLIKEQQSSGVDQPDSMFRLIMDKAKFAESTSQTQPEAFQIGGARRKWLVRAVSIAAILLILITTFLVLNRKEQNQVAQRTEEKKPVSDAPPGGDKAILTLANGNQIILDTAANGAVAQQGGIKVIKLGGQLSYTEEGASSEVLFNTITTPRGGQYQLELADGSKVWLNAASSLRFPTSFVGKERIVELTGEGYFEVVHNEAMPFHVKVKNNTQPGQEMDVAVLGTHFNINSYADEPNTKTTLLEGRVRITKGEKYVFLNPGQQASIPEGVASIRVINDVDMDGVMAWKNGLIQFSGADLGAVMRSIARWYDVEVSYGGNVESAHLSGKVSRNLNLSQVIKVLEESGIDIKIEGRRITASPKP